MYHKTKPDQTKPNLNHCYRKTVVVLFNPAEEEISELISFQRILVQK